MRSRFVFIRKRSPCGKFSYRRWPVSYSPYQIRDVSSQSLHRDLDGAVGVSVMTLAPGVVCGPLTWAIRTRAAQHTLDTLLLAAVLLDPNT